MATIGQMNRFVTIQTKTTTADGVSQQQETWADLCTVRAAMESLTSREVFSASQAGVIATKRITIWHRNDVEENAGVIRVLYGENRVANVVAALRTHLPGPPQLELLCAEALPLPS